MFRFAPDCIHICLHKDTRHQATTRCLSGQSTDPVASATTATAVIALEDFYGIDVGFQLDREVNVMAVLCRKNVVLLALNSRQTMEAWSHAIRRHLGTGWFCALCVCVCLCWLQKFGHKKTQNVVELLILDSRSIKLSLSVGWHRELTKIR